MSRVCQCGGIIRENGKPFWDILPSCTCQNPVMVKAQPTVYTTGTEALPDNNVMGVDYGHDAKPPDTNTTGGGDE